MRRSVGLFVVVCAVLFALGGCARASTASAPAKLATGWPGSRVASVTTDVPLGYGEVWQVIYRVANPSTPSIDTTGGAYATLAKFSLIANGMTIDEVREIVGCRGVDVGQSTTNYDSDDAVLMLGWEGESPGSEMTVSFVNGKANSKSQTGLK